MGADPDSYDVHQNQKQPDVDKTETYYKMYCMGDFFFKKSNDTFHLLDCRILWKLWNESIIYNLHLLTHNMLHSINPFLWQHSRNQSYFPHDLPEGAPSTPLHRLAHLHISFSSVTPPFLHSSPSINPSISVTLHFLLLYFCIRVLSWKQTDALTARWGAIILIGVKSLPFIAWLPGHVFTHMLTCTEECVAQTHRLYLL